MALAAALLAAVWIAADFLLLVFAGVLLAVLLGSLNELWEKYLHTGKNVSFFLTLITIAILVAVGTVLLLPAVTEQANTFIQKIPEYVSQIRKQVEASGIWQYFSGLASPMKLLSSRPGILSRITGVFSSTFNILANIFIVIFIGFYIAANPEVYKRGVVLLFPPSHRENVRAVLDMSGATLKMWIVGRLIDMLIVGAATTIGLWIIGIPLALLLGVIAGVLTFIPYIGPLISVVPALLISLTQGFQAAAYVLALYAAVQLVESYFITPLIQKKAVDLPPALTISAQVFLGIAVGGLGVALATPLAAVAMVMTKQVYVKEYLENSNS